MAWNSTDTDYMNLAEPLFGGLISGHGPDGQVAFHFVVNSGPYPANAAEVLREAMKAAMRFTPDVTTWVDVTAKLLPQFVVDAIAENVRAGNRIAVTYAGGVSHDPSRPLAPALVDALRAARVHGELWHPVLKMKVRAIDV